MKIEKVNIETLENIVSLNTNIFKALYSWTPFTLEEYKEKLAKVTPLLLVVKDGDTIVGDSISFEKDDFCYIWILGVSSTHRNQGIATQLFTINETYAKENAYKKIGIKIYNVSKEMLRLAIGRGYTIIDIIKNENPIYNAVIVELTIQ